MKFSINSREFEKLLSKVLPALPTRTPIDALNSFKFEFSGSNLVITGSDNAVFIRVGTQIDGSVETEFLIEGKFLYDSIRMLEDTMLNFRIEGDGTTMSMNTDSGKYTLSLLSAAEYPAFPEFSDADFHIKIPADTLRKALELTTFAADNDSSVRPALNGVLFECKKDGINFVATDGHKLVRYRLAGYEFAEERKIIIPKAALEAMVKMMGNENLTLSFTQRFVHLASGNTELIARLVEANYPDYSNVIPLENENKLTISKKVFASALRRAQVYTTQNFEQVKLSLTDDLVTVLTENAERGYTSNETVECEYLGTAMDIAFNAHWLYAVVSRFDGEMMEMRIGQPSRACIITRHEKNPDDDLLMLIMPLRLNS